MDFTTIVNSLQSQADLTEEQMSEAIGLLLAGQIETPTIVDFLEALYQKGETVSELVGAAQAMRAAMVRIHSTQRPVVDTCGTGGDGSQTFNISTATAIVLAATGCRVAKHGNRKITSSTGSADVLGELGINLEAPPELVEQALEQIGMCFCFAPYFHPAMRHVGPARQQITHATIFNRLGPLTNPASAEHQLIGVGSIPLQDKLAQTLQRLGTTRSLVVRGEDGVDELSLSAPTRVLEVTPTAIVEHSWEPNMFGMAAADRQQLFADDPISSAQCIRQVLSGVAGPCRDVVVMNAAAALWLTDHRASLIDCAERVQRAIDDGRALNVVHRLAAITKT